MIVEKIIELLKAAPAVAAIVGDNVYPVELPDAPDYPAIVVSKANGFGEYDLQGDVGVEDARVQVDLFSAKGYASLLALRGAVRRHLSGYRNTEASGDTCVIQSCTCINDFDLTEQGTERAGPRLRRRVLEFRVWNTEV